MSKDKSKDKFKKVSPEEQKSANDVFNDQIQHLTDQIGEIVNPKQISDLENMLNDMIGMAKVVQEEFNEEMSQMAENGDITENDLSASIEEVIQVSENSPYMDEMLKGDEWKKVLKGFGEIKFASGSKDAD
tara:strand:- start:201 stop:593 length:393 start_codon:yes stop_codon:yes gene_type:complete